MVIVGRSNTIFIIAEQRTRKYLTLRNDSLTSVMNLMKKSNDHNMHETECIVTEDSIMQRHDEAGNPKPNSDIYRSLPVSNINIQP